MTSAISRYKLKRDKKGHKRREDCETEKNCICKEESCEKRFVNDPDVIWADTDVHSGDGPLGKRPLGKHMVVDHNEKEYENDGNSDEFSVHYKVNELILKAIQEEDKRPSENPRYIRWSSG